MICAEHGGSEKLVSGFVLREGAAKILAEARAAFSTEWLSPAVPDMKTIVVTALTATEREMVDLRGFQIGPRSPLNREGYHACVEADADIFLGGAQEVEIVG